jgi:hypothetical protein
LTNVGIRARSGRTYAQYRRSAAVVRRSQGSRGVVRRNTLNKIYFSRTLPVLMPVRGGRAEAGRRTPAKLLTVLSTCRVGDGEH